MSEVSKSLRSIDQSLNSATDSRRASSPRSRCARSRRSRDRSPPRTRRRRSPTTHGRSAGRGDPARPAAAERRPKARSGRPGDEGRRQRHRRLDGAADRASGGASHPADQLADRLLRGDGGGLHRRRADLQLPRRAARRAARRARPEAGADLYRAAAGLLHPGAHLDLRRLRARLPGDQLPALAVRGARPLPAGEARLPAVPDRLAGAVHARLRLRLLRAAAAGLRLLPRLPAVRRADAEPRPPGSRART